MSDRDNTSSEENIIILNNQESFRAYEQEKLKKLDELIEEIVWQQSLMLKLSKNEGAWL